MCLGCSLVSPLEESLRPALGVSSPFQQWRKQTLKCWTPVAEVHLRELGVSSAAVVAVAVLTQVLQVLQVPIRGQHRMRG